MANSSVFADTFAYIAAEHTDIPAVLQLQEEGIACFHIPRRGEPRHGLLEAPDPERPHDGSRRVSLPMLHVLCLRAHCGRCLPEYFFHSLQITSPPASSRMTAMKTESCTRASSTFSATETIPYMSRRRCWRRIRTTSGQSSTISSHATLSTEHCSLTLLNWTPHPYPSRHHD